MNEHSSPAAPSDSEKPSARKAARDSMFLAVGIERLSTGEAFAGRARNVSEGGLMADDLDGLAVGERVGLTMRGVGRVLGQVAWIRDGQVGIAFDAAIDPRWTRKPVVAARAQPAPARALFPKASE